MEAFSRMMRVLDSNGALEGFKVGRHIGEEVCISHLLFADDMLILCGADVNQFRSIQSMLSCFEAVLGLKINLFKSKVIPVGSIGNVQELVTILGCGVSSLPLTYLGLPLGARYKSVHVWDGIIERME